jgi:hypothetical protein
MSDHELAALLDQYRAGLVAEIAILHQLETVAARQQAATAADDLAALDQAADLRDSLMAGLVTIESQIRPVRETLSQARAQARRLPEYDETAALHQEAMALVATILKSDAESIEALAQAELTRREAVRAVERGETTLAAYRRAATVVPGATLVNRRG